MICAWIWLETGSNELYIVQFVEKKRFADERQNVGEGKGRAGGGKASLRKTPAARRRRGGAARRQEKLKRFLKAIGGTKIEMEEQLQSDRSPNPHPRPLVPMDDGLCSLFSGSDLVETN